MENKANNDRYKLIIVSKPKIKSYKLLLCDFIMALLILLLTFILLLKQYILRIHVLFTNEFPLENELCVLAAAAPGKLKCLNPRTRCKGFFTGSFVMTFQNSRI